MKAIELIGVPPLRVGGIVPRRRWPGPFNFGGLAVRECSGNPCTCPTPGVEDAGTALDAAVENACRQLIDHSLELADVASLLRLLAQRVRGIDPL